MVALMKVGIVHWTLVARIGDSYSASLGCKEAGCCGQMTHDPYHVRGLHADSNMNKKKATCIRPVCYKPAYFRDTIIKSPKYMRKIRSALKSHKLDDQLYARSKRELIGMPVLGICGVILVLMMI